MRKGLGGQRERERERVAEGSSCEREIICCFTLCLRNWGRGCAAETESEETEKHMLGRKAN